MKARWMAHCAAPKSTQPSCLKSSCPRALSMSAAAEEPILKPLVRRVQQDLPVYDGPWNTQENMVDQAIEFTGMDLNSPARVSAERFDLAMSLEVAEHLHPSTAEAFIGFLRSFRCCFVRRRLSRSRGYEPHQRAEAFLLGEFVWRIGVPALRSVSAGSMGKPGGGVLVSAEYLSLCSHRQQGCKATGGDGPEAAQQFSYSWIASIRLFSRRIATGSLRR